MGKERLSTLYMLVNKLAAQGKDHPDAPRTAHLAFCVLGNKGIQRVK